jgi:hypothetical protein
MGFIYTPDELLPLVLLSLSREGTPESVVGGGGGPCDGDDGGPRQHFFLHLRRFWKVTKSINLMTRTGVYYY